MKRINDNTSIAYEVLEKNAVRRNTNPSHNL